jgi:RNA polymerase sigma-70 factor (ECF subfamily)
MTFMVDPVRDATYRVPLTGFEQFYEATFRRVVGRVFLIVGDAHLAEELAQDAMVEIMDQWADRCERSVDSNIAWTVAIAANLARRHWHRLKIRARALTRLAARLQPEVSSFDVEALARIDTYRRLTALPRRQREIATLWLLGDMTAEDIADTLGITASAVRTHTQRIRLRLTSDGSRKVPEARDECDDPSTA